MHNENFLWMSNGQNAEGKLRMMCAKWEKINLEICIFVIVKLELGDAFLEMEGVITAIVEIALFRFRCLI